MKVFCKCCHKGFDYDMYMGLCPRCGRVYRRGLGVYSAIERDMAGDFHIDANEGGLNRGIDGVVYNQASAPAKKILNNESKAHLASEMVTDYNNAVPSSRPAMQTSRPASTFVQTAPQGNVSSQSYKVNMNQLINNRQGYYSPNHGTRMNQGVNNKNSAAGGVIAIIFIIMFIMSFIISMLS